MENTIPVTISEEAAAWIAEIGMQHEYEVILEHAQQTIPQLQSIEVTLEEAPWAWDEPKIVLEVHRPHLGEDETRGTRTWIDWFVGTFPPEVQLHFLLTPFYETNHGRTRIP